MIQQSSCYVMVLVSLISLSIGKSVTRTIPIKLFRHEEVCDNMYGTMLDHHFQLQHPLQLGAKCATDPLCYSTTYDYVGNSQRNSDFFENRTNVGCSNFVSYSYVSTELEPRIIPRTINSCPIPHNTEHVHYQNMTTAVSPIGTEIQYTCHPCSYFHPVGSSGTVMCLQDGTWTDAICHFGPDVGHIYDGTPIPAGAIGCNHTVSEICSSNNTIGDFRLDGYVGTCYCDEICCGHMDCCFDSMCPDNFMDYLFYS